MRLYRAQAKRDAVRASRASLLAPLAIYAALSLVAIVVAVAREQNPLVTDGWLDLPSPLGHVSSLVLGLLLSALTVTSTRRMVRRWGWARALHTHLRTTVRHSSSMTIAVVGIASATSEELFFRGLGATTIGLVLSSLAFGLLHQARGRVRWIWAAWAASMGLALGAVFLATGSLVGPIVAHATINVANLRFLRDTDVEPRKPRRLGGLLGSA